MPNFTIDSNARKEWRISILDYGFLKTYSVRLNPTLRCLNKSNEKKIYTCRVIGWSVEPVGSKNLKPGPASLVTLLILPRNSFNTHSAKTNFFYSVYLYRWLAYLTHISGDFVGNFHNNHITIEFYF